MRAVFRYPGSKWSIAQWIIEHFPAGYEKMVYLEPFVGSGAVFFNKTPGAVETINDLDGDIVNLFRVLRESPEELKEQLRLTPYSREEYDLSFHPCDDPIEKARRYMIKTTQAIGAKLAGSKCGWRNHKQVKIGGTAFKWGGIVDTIDEATRRLRGDTTHLVQIEHMDALKLIEAAPDIDPASLRPKGEWADKMVRDWHCSECGKSVPKQVRFDGYCYDDKLNFCPECGADMRKEATSNV